MVSNGETWTADWAQSLRALIKGQGYDTVLQFLAAFPGEPYVLLAKRLAPWVAPIQLSRLQIEAAKRSGKLRDAAMDAFARELNGRLPDGWVPDGPNESRAAGAFAAATTLLLVDAESPQLLSNMEAMYVALKELNPPPNWRPRGPHDRLIIEAFNQGWPRGGSA